MALPPLKAPTADGELFTRPGLDRLSHSQRANELIFSSSAAADLQGRSLAQFRAWCRSDTEQMAREYTREMTGDDGPTAPMTGPWFVTGHQPGLFHPGVWAKNFSVAALSGAQHGVGVNLIVDNDLLASTSIGVPRGSRIAPRIEPFAMLPPQSARPWEETLVEDAKLFESFGSRVADAMEADWGFRPLVADGWSDAVATRENSPRLSDCLTSMRMRQERRWGIGTLEVPLSRLEEGDPFRWFAAHILARLVDFQRVHNAALASYRRRNRIRSQAHPVPELRRRDDWLEAPFWIWQVGESVRHPLFIRPQGKRVEVACDHKQIGKLRLSTEMDACCAVEDLKYLSDEGWRIRSRALTTTLFARLGLADLFVHGIGGAKYDEMTDVITERFYGMRPPVFLTLTATQHLPLDPFPAERADAWRLRRQLRDLDFNPDQVPGTPDMSRFVTERDRLLAELQGLRGDDPQAAERRRRRGVSRPLYRYLKQLRAAQQTALDPYRRQLREQLSAIETALAANRILKSREFAWCLFPEPLLHSLASRVQQAVSAGATQ